MPIVHMLPTDLLLNMDRPHGSCHGVPYVAGGDYLEPVPVTLVYLHPALIR